MDDPSAHTTQLHAWLDRIQAGDLAAREELLRSLGRRLEHLARKMLQGFPSVRRWAQTDDVLQNGIMRLLRALQELRPASMREFFNLAAVQMRRELLDLARHFAEANRREPFARDLDGLTERTEPSAADEADDLERWTRFHEEVEKLPEKERELVGLVYYQGWTQAAVAEFFGETVRTVQRHWQTALVKLHGVLKME